MLTQFSSDKESAKLHHEIVNVIQYVLVLSDCSHHCMVKAMRSVASKWAAGVVGNFFFVMERFSSMTATALCQNYSKVFGT